MSALLGSEFLRLRSRRIVWVLALLMIAGMLVATSILVTKSHRADAGALASARARYLDAVHNCESAPGASASSCTTISQGEFLPGTFELVILPMVFEHVAFLLVVIGLVIGSSSVGADWQSGSFGTLLTWESRRVRVFLVRVAVVAVVVFVLAIGLLGVLSALLALVALVRGTTAWLDASWVSDCLQTGARVGAMAALGALLGLSVAMVGRSTGAALAALFVYLAVFESLLRALYPKSGPWLLGPNVTVFVTGIAGHPGTSQLLTVGHSVGVIFVYAAVPLVLATAWFTSRDAGT